MHLTHDLRYALRLIRQNWAFSLTVVLILSLCIGANTAVLSVVNAAMLRPLGYPEPERLAQLVIAVPSQGSGALSESHTGTTWEMVRDQAPALEAAVYSGWTTGVNFTVGQSASYVKQQRVCAGFFHVLGVAPAVGREFTADEDRAGGSPAVILSHALWNRFFNGDPGVVGKAVLLRGEPYTVAGVMPRGFRTSVDADLWTPIKASRTGEGGGANFGVIARLKPGVTWQQANSQLAVIGEELKKSPNNFQYGKDAVLRVVSLQEGMTNDLRKPLMLMWAAVAAVFVLGCVNIGGMLLARASGRVGEISTRLALGAPLSRIVRQLLVESVVLGLFGGAAGAAVGYGALAALRNIGSSSFSFLATVEPDWRVLAATIVLTLIAGVAFGIMPAWQASRVDLRSAQSGSRGVAGRKRFVSLGSLVGGQVALTVPLLIGAGLLLRTFMHLWSLNPGFDPSNVLAARFSLQDARYDTTQKVNVLFDRTLERLRETPGIESAAAALSLPYERWLNNGLSIPGREKVKGANITNVNYVTTDFFNTLRIPVLRGRAFTLADGATSGKVAIANQTFVRNYLGDEEPLGRPVKLGGNQILIVGVVGDLQQRPGWGSNAPLTKVPALYIPAAQTSDGFLKMVHTWFAPNWIVRGTAGSNELRGAIENATRSVDPLLPMASFRSVSDMKADSLTFQRFLVVVVGAIAALAMLLSALGIYGLIANLVAERTRELGIRMALGSSVAEAIATVLRPGVMWVAAGAVVGGGAAVLLEKLLKSYLWGVKSSDPTTMVGVAIGLLVAAALASLIPSLRITRLNPADTLRAE